MNDMMKKTTVISFRVTVGQIMELQKGQKIIIEMSGKKYAFKQVE